MAKKIVRLTESDLTRLVKKVINEDEHRKHHASWKDRQTKKSMDESEEEPSDEETKKLVDYFWDSMTTAEKKKLITKVDRERKEKGLPSLRPKS